MRSFLDKNLFLVLSAVLVFSASIVCPQPASGENPEPPDPRMLKAVVAPSSGQQEAQGQNGSIKDLPPKPADIVREAAKALAEEAAKNPGRKVTRPFGKDAVKVSGNEIPEDFVEDPGLPIDLAQPGVVAELEPEVEETGEAPPAVAEDSTEKTAKAEPEEIAGGSVMRLSEKMARKFSKTREWSTFAPT